MEVQDSSVINVVMKAHKKTNQDGTWKQNMELYYIGVIMRFEMKVHFTADHEGKFLNNSPFSGKRH